MSNHRNIAIVALSVLIVAGAALATIPALAEEETAGLAATVTVDSTAPKVTGTVTVTFDGVGVPGALVNITSTHDLLPLPAAVINGASGVSGTVTFDFGVISTAGVPGPHTLTVDVSYQGETITLTLPYTA